LTDDTSGTSNLSIDLNWDDNGKVPPATLTLPTMAFLTEGGSTPASGMNNDFEPADFSETQSAQDSEIRVDGYPPGAWISRSSNTVDDVIYGVALHLHDTTDVNGEELTLTRDIQSVKDKLTKLVDAYNFAVEYIKEKTGYNDVLKTAGLLMGDYVVSTIRQQIRTPLITQTNGFIEDIDTFLTPGHLGFKLDRDGVLSLDMNVLDEAIAEDYMSVLAIIGADKTGSSDSNTIEFYGLSVDLSQNGTFTATVSVKQGFTGAIEDALDNMLKVTTGSIQIDQKHVDNQIEYLQEKIEIEENRLTKREERLIARFSRLEKNIALIQQQMSALGFGL